MKIEQISIGFNEKQKKLLDEESQRLGSSIASIVRSIITEYFEKREKERHESRKRSQRN